MDGERGAYSWREVTTGFGISLSMVTRWCCPRAAHELTSLV